MNDPHISVSVSDDKLTGYLQFYNIDENYSVSREHLDIVIAGNGIVFGLDTEMLNNIVRSPKPYLYAKTCIAQGIRPKNGEDGHLEFLLNLGADAKKPVENEDGTVDFKEVISISNVRKGQLIAQRFPSGEGTAGKAVTGEVLPAVNGKEARFKIGKNVVVDAEQNNMYAAIDGMVSRTDRDKINVFPVYEVNGDLDYAIGNINFVGNVVIRGNVCPGFRVKAAGDIRITGFVEAAELEAEGSIEISSGILGQNKAKITAGKDIKSSFIQDAVAVAGMDIIVSQSIMHSTIRAGRNVICRGVRGLIVGGIVQAGEKVTSRIIGNVMSTATVIEVGVKPEHRNEMLQLRAQLKDVIANIEKTDKALNLLDQLASNGTLSSDKIALRIKLHHTKKQAVEEQLEIKERILELEKSLEDSERSKVEVVSSIYGGTKIVIGRYTRFVKDPLGSVYFHMSEGEVIYSALTRV
jgi:uncharacterized protein